MFLYRPGGRSDVSVIGVVAVPVVVVAVRMSWSIRSCLLNINQLVDNVVPVYLHFVVAPRLVFNSLR